MPDHKDQRYKTAFFLYFMTSRPLVILQGALVRNCFLPISIFYQTTVKSYLQATFVIGFGTSCQQMSYQPCPAGVCSLLLSGLLVSGFLALDLLIAGLQSPSHPFGATFYISPLRLPVPFNLSMTSIDLYYKTLSTPLNSQHIFLKLKYSTY